jgi:hypothetical protein
MKYLVFAVYSNNGHVATHFNNIDLGFKNPEDVPDKIINKLGKTGLDNDSLYELFVFKSAQNFGDAPEQVAYWNREDDVFGGFKEEDEEE